MLSNRPSTGELMINRIGNGADASADIYPDAGEEQRRQSEYTLTIRTVARMFKVSTFKLRLYECLGLIRRQRAGRDRVYSWSECERIALIVKAGYAGLGVRPIRPIVRAMSERSTAAARDAGRFECLALIRKLESRQHLIGNVLDELYRIDRELSDHLETRSPSGATADWPSRPSPR